MLKKIYILGLLGLTTLTTNAQTQVVTGVMNGKDYGVTYTLPKTAIKANIKVSKITYTPGEFAKYANRFLHLNQVDQSASTSFKLDQFEINLVGNPDPEKVYFVKLKDKTVAPNIELNYAGVIKSINIPFKSNKEIAATELVPATNLKLDPKRFYTEEILMANSTGKIAELVAKEIYAIRESRNSLLRGEYDDAPVDGEFLKILLNKMDEQESALLSLFTGSTEVTPITKSIELDITDEFQEMVIARFSTKVGVVDADNLIGEPITISLKDLKTVRIDENAKGKAKQEGIAYNLPGRGYIEVNYQGKTISKGEFPLTQFGTVEFLAPALFNKKSTIQVSFDVQTGGLLKVNQEEM